MFKVLLVDDEPWTLKGLHKIFKWETRGFKVINETTSSRKAFDIICTEKPDVVFTDIRMPEISGLELMKMTREKGINTEFIIISGFAEFSYAQEALQMGAFEYQLKPISPELTDELLQRIYNKLNKQKILKDVEIFEKIMDDSENSEHFLTASDFTNSFSHYQAVVAVGQEIEKLNLQELIRDTGTVFTLKLGLNKMFYIINCNGDVAGILKSAFTLCAWKDKPSFGVSRMDDKRKHIRRLYREAEIAAYNSFITGVGGIFSYNDKNGEYIKKLYEKIVFSLENKNYSETKEIITELTQAFNQNAMGMAQLILLWNQLASYFATKPEYGTLKTEIEFMDCEHMSNKFTSFQNLCSYLTNIIILISSNYEHSMEYHDVNENFKKILKYINQHYYEDLKLKELAEKYFINLTYCCELFKKVTAKTFVEYLSGIRIEKSAELLNESGLSILEISKKVGYEDYYYFNRVFKKFYNETPLKYREKFKSGY